VSSRGTTFTGFRIDVLLLQAIAGFPIDPVEGREFWPSLLVRLEDVFMSLKMPFCAGKLASDISKHLVNNILWLRLPCRHGVAPRCDCLAPGMSL
jgi:hypothetical protein